MDSVICQQLTIHVTTDLYVYLTNCIPLAFLHDGAYVTTCLYTFDPSFRFTIQVTPGLVKHSVEGLNVVTRGTTVVHTAKEGDDPFRMSRHIICICPQLDIHRVHPTPRTRVLVSDTGAIFAVRGPSHRLV